MNYIHINDVVATDGFEIEFQSKTPKSMGASCLTRTGSIGCRPSSKSDGLSWGRDRSGHDWNDDIGFTLECPVGGLMKRHCRLECISASLCESLRLRTLCVETWEWGELTAPPSVSPLTLEDAEGKTKVAELEGIVCSDGRPDVEGKEKGHSNSSEGVQSTGPDLSHRFIF